ncbi:YggT family protein [Microbacterium sp. YY-01]|uniref:YggT family protein n=1 Tax=Microbacterium sp. YY-01 TaxID=3421634 RepID=UPI003D16B8F7
MSLIAAIANFALLIYFMLLLVRLVFGYIPLFQRGWRPRGAMLVVGEIVYTLTDPPIKFFRRFIRPMRVGDALLDFSFTVVMILVLILMSITRSLI